MRSKIYIPVADVDYLDFEYNGRKISLEDYFDLVYETVKRQGKRINQYILSDNFLVSHKTIINSRGGDYRGGQVDFKFVMTENDAYLFDSNKHEIDENFLRHYEDRGEMFIMIIDVIKDLAEYDGEVELKFWIDDSKHILKEKSLDFDTKVKHLPKRDLYVEMENGDILRLKNCKIFETYRTNLHPYRIALIVEELNCIQNGRKENEKEDK